MTDIEKVKQGLECCCEHIEGMNCDKCPYDKEQEEIAQINQCTSALAYDALALLKEQKDALEQMRLDNEDLRKCYTELLKEREAVRSVKQIEQTEWTVCGNCKNHIISRWTFCPYCGRSVKWE